MRSQTVDVRTDDRLVTDITQAVAAFVDQGETGERGGDGLVNFFVPHATAGVAIIETGSGSEADLADAISRLLPRDEHYVHRHGSVGHGGDHVLPAFVSPSLTVPVFDGALQLGTWQSIAVVDPNRDNPERVIRLTLVP
jgi:secondary thiamine-phosphate synthase enzyme